MFAYSVPGGSFSSKCRFNGNIMNELWIFDTYAVSHKSTLKQQMHSHGPASSCSPLSVSSICDSHMTLPNGNYTYGKITKSLIKQEQDSNLCNGLQHASLQSPAFILHAWIWKRFVNKAIYKSFLIKCN